MQLLVVVILGCWTAAHQKSYSSGNPFPSTTTPIELSALSNLQNLQLNDNSFRDTIPHYLETFIFLQNKILIGDVPISLSNNMIVHLFNTDVVNELIGSTIQLSTQPNIVPLPQSLQSQGLASVIQLIQSSIQPYIVTSQSQQPSPSSSIIQLLVLVFFLLISARRILHLFIDHTTTKKNTCSTARMPRCLSDTMTTKQLWFILLSIVVMTVSGQTVSPTGQPSQQPSTEPTNQPSQQPSQQPSTEPTNQPSNQPSMIPTRQPSSHPSSHPSSLPTTPSSQPSQQPSNLPTAHPSCQPTKPSQQPTIQPTIQPTRRPSQQPSMQPSSFPSKPSGQPSRQPTMQPTKQPVSHPTNQPTRRPSTQPSAQPSRIPSAQPTTRPSRQPSSQPSEQPTNRPTTPSGQPSHQPSQQPTRQPTSQVRLIHSRIPFLPTCIFSSTSFEVYNVPLLTYQRSYHDVCVFVCCSRHNNHQHALLAQVHSLHDSRVLSRPCNHHGNHQVIPRRALL